MKDKEFDLILQEFGESLEKLREINQKLIQKQSYYDTLLSEYYHLFESGSFPPNIRKEIDKGFDECLEERRIYKSRLAKILSITATLKNKGIETDITTDLKGNEPFKPKILTEEFEKYKKYLK